MYNNITLPDSNFDLHNLTTWSEVNSSTQVVWDIPEWEQDPEQFRKVSLSNIESIQVDKTQQLLQLTNITRVCFFRPRRMGKTTAVNLLEKMSQATYQQSLDANYVLPDELKGTAFADAPYDKKSFLDAPYVVHLDFSDGGIIRDVASFADKFDKEKQRQAKISTLQSKHQQDLDKLKNQQQQAIENLENQHQQAIEKLENQQQQAIKDLESPQQQSFDVLKNQQQQAIKDLENQQQQSFDALKNQQQQSLDKLQDKQKLELASLEAAYIEACKKPKNKLDDIASEEEQQLDLRLASIKENAEAEKQRVSNAAKASLDSALEAGDFVAYNNIFTTLNQSLSLIDQKCFQEISSIEEYRSTVLVPRTQKYKSELEELEAKHKAMLSTLTSDHASALSKLENEHKDQLSKLEEEHKNELSELKNKQQDQLSKLKEEHKDELSELKNKQQDQLSELKNKQQDQLSKLENKQQDQLSKLENKHQASLTKLNSESVSANVGDLLGVIDVWLIGLFNRKLNYALSQNIALLRDLCLKDLEVKNQALLDIVSDFQKRTNEFRGSADYISAVLEKMPNASIVLLIDEYDAVINNVMHQPSIFSEVLRLFKEFFQILKTRDNKFKFVFVTGITSFHSSSFFSSVNQLQDISWDSDFADLAGFTDAEIKKYFGPIICRRALENKVTPQYLLGEMKRYYNGYCFSIQGSTETNLSKKVSSPIDIKRFLSRSDIAFSNFWVNSGSSIPAFVRFFFGGNYKSMMLNIICKIEQKSLTLTADALTESPDFTKVFVQENKQDLFNAEFLPIMLLQSGYLTLDWNRNPSDNNVVLKVPNFEVATAFTRRLMPLFELKQFKWDQFAYQINPWLWRSAILIDHLFSGNASTVEIALFELCNSFLSYEVIKDISESQWRDFLYSMLERDAELRFFHEVFIQINREMLGAQGRSDIVLTNNHDSHRVVLELKVVKRTCKKEEDIEAFVSSNVLHRLLAKAVKQVRNSHYGEGANLKLDRFVCILVVFHINNTIRFRILCEMC